MGPDRHGRRPRPTVFAQPTPGQVRDQVDVIAMQLTDKVSPAAEFLLDAKEVITAFAVFPQTHRLKTWSNPIERLNREIKRRTNVIRILPARSRSTGSSAPS